jgi:aminomuconate-semialdehyde/2-hydroxymuconate-6-semialdehyde dehydrogenase
MKEVLHYIDGRFVAPSTGEFFDNPNPATVEILARVARGSAADVDAAVAAARRALKGPWGATSTAERADFVDAIADGIEARTDELVALESADTGKPVSLAGAVDIPRAVSNFRFFAGAVRHSETGCHPMEGALNYTLHRPVGVMGLITPWNLPLYLLTWKVAPALAMGNTIVAKPSEVTPMSAGLLAEIIDSVGLPPGVFNLVHGYGGEVGQPLVAHKDVGGISFTGGTETGAAVAAAASSSFKKLSLELGGKNASVVFADCDFEATVKGVARAGFANQGQVCLCGSRILVERPLLERFTEALVTEVASLRPGDPSAAETNFGSLVSLAHREKIEGYVALAREEGGEILLGGKRPEMSQPFDGGAFYEPTIVGGLPHDSRTATEEIFGPVVTVHPFDSEDEAIEIANEVRYGLAASVWTSNLGKAHRVSAQLETGMVWVNTWLLRDLRVPFGGIKDSGVGREGGRYSLEFFSESRNICVKL